MTTKNFNDKRVLVPTDGGWLCNESQRTMSVDNRVVLGIEDNGEQWSEITLERKQELEALWNAETENPDEATKDDLYNALAELGVE